LNGGGLPEVKLSAIARPSMRVIPAKSVSITGMEDFISRTISSIADFDSSGTTMASATPANFIMTVAIW
jgi:predicted transcriptional regulator